MQIARGNTKYLLAQIAGRKVSSDRQGCRSLEPVLMQ